MPQYAKPLTLHRGVDNQIQFQFLNQQQKPVDITGKSITCRILNYTGTAVLIQKALTLQLPATGIAALYITPSDLFNIDPQKCYYSLEIPVDSFGYPVFVDQNAGARGDLNIVNSVLPSFTPSQTITIPTGQPFPNTANYTSTEANIYYSSVINTDNAGVLTLQTQFEEYYGNVTIEGSTIVDNDWYPILTTDTYSNTSDTYGYTVVGFHPFVRMQFTSNAGAVTNILSR